MVGGIVEVGAPATQIFSAYLHVRGLISEYIGYEILSVMIGTWQVVGITVSHLTTPFLPFSKRDNFGVSAE